MKELQKLCDIGASWNRAGSMRNGDDDLSNKDELLEFSGAGFRQPGGLREGSAITKYCRV
jgi:hypothetical protein